ncbi:MAG: hypothetical protein DDT21_01146 [Syntrophomonadaceae bacterium]|nr:hypothetical protein [Bacillota bacterium]
MRFYVLGEKFCRLLLGGVILLLALPLLHYYGYQAIISLYPVQHLRPTEETVVVTQYPEQSGKLGGWWERTAENIREFYQHGF